MLSSVRYGVRVFLFTGASLAALAAPCGLQAEEEPASPPAEALETPRPDAAAAPAAETSPEELPPPSDEPTAAKTGPKEREASESRANERSFNEPVDLPELASKIAEELNLAGPRKRPEPRSAWNAALEDEACPGDCPVCGAPLGAADAYSPWKGDRSRRRKSPHGDWLHESLDVSELGPERKDEPAEKLQPGEPAQVILELREKLGSSALHGTEFTVEPETFAKWVRALDREMPQPPPAPTEAPQPDYAAGGYSSDDEANEATISALRAASRQLDDAAELLEQQNLFERADELREQADRLRRDARVYLKERTLPAPPAQTDSKPAAAVEPVEYHVPLKVKIDAGNLEKYREGFETRHPETRRPKNPPMIHFTIPFNR